jgi:hypothetical protein
MADRLLSVPVQDECDVNNENVVARPTEIVMAFRADSPEPSMDAIFFGMTRARNDKQKEKTSALIGSI